MREDTRFGNLFVPEVVLGKIFEYTGVFSISKCVTVCKEWKNFLLNDSNPIVNYLWKHVAMNEGFLNGMANTKRKEFDEEVASSSSTTTTNNNNERKDSGSGGGVSSSSSNGGIRSSNNNDDGSYGEFDTNSLIDNADDTLEQGGRF